MCLHTRSLQHDVGRSVMLGLGATRDYRDTEMSRDFSTRYCKYLLGENNAFLSALPLNPKYYFKISNIQISKINHTHRTVMACQMLIIVKYIHTITKTNDL